MLPVNMDTLSGVYSTHIDIILSDFPDFISPLCLPVDSFARSASNLTGTMGIIAGWGSMTAGD